ncbi:cupin domain-containing protein [Vineibacter terrae]|uniref:cupin domain-containing protein n=1 Tax=Vineibacter terrae TaxID=2586908 RepID=UPI002E35DB70|nr:cupin domain-containing protein [Vineibacter terrae]HEX2890793.1 cupin domain-containing protein [Vineibacter terrae]
MRFSIGRTFAAAACASLLLAGGYALGQAKAGGDTVKPIFAQKLATMPGKTMTAITVDYAPGGASAAHRHADSAEIFAYVVQGAVRSKVNDGPETVYKAGQFWYEPPGARHGVSANASTTEPARILAVIVASDGANLTTFEK